MNKLILGVSASLLATGLFGSVSAIAQASNIQAQSGVNSTLIAQAGDQALIGQNRGLLLQNGQTARNIAAKVGAPVSNSGTPSGGNPLQVNQQLILQNRATFISIAKKVGATVPNVDGPGGGDLATQNHQLLLGNRQIVRAIAQKLGVQLPAPPQLSGSMVQQNNQLLLGNRNALQAIAGKVGAAVAPAQ